MSKAIAKEVVAGFKSLSMSERQQVESRYPLRPGTGTQGQKFKMQTNVIPVPKITTSDIIHYDVTIDPTVPPRVNRAVFYQFEKEHAKSFGGAVLAFDGRKNVFANKELPNKVISIDFEYKEGDRPKNFKVTLKFAAKVNMANLHQFMEGKLNYTPQDAIQALDVVLRHGPSRKLTLVGRSLFSPLNKSVISGGVEIWGGYFSSLRITQSKAVWNVDTAYTAFYRPQGLVEFLVEFVHARNPQDLSDGLRDADSVKFGRALRNLRIEVTHLKTPRKYRVVGVSRTPADKTFFNDEDGNKLSVAEYFSKKYKPLQYPFLPCAQVGNPEKNIFIPLELCKLVEGQKYPKKLDENQTSDMIKIACKKPGDRFNQIKNGISALKEAQASYTDAFGVQIGSGFANVEGRILPTPKILYHPSSREASIVPQNGSWNLKDKKAETCAELHSWAVVNFAGPRDASPQSIDGFVRVLVNTIDQNGMKVAVKNPPIVNGRTQPKDVTQAIDKAIAEAKSASGGKACQILLCIMPRGPTTEVYGTVKRHCETHLGLPTQCMLSKHIMKASPQYTANLFLKINSKLGGCNLSLGDQLPFIREKPTIVFGADVTHGGIGDRGRPSIAAVVASMDHKLSAFASNISVQPPREEMIVNLKEIVKGFLINFFKVNSAKPRRILFYRDGVSEGQFEQVQEIEIKAIREACADLEASYKPTITFVIVQKRHNIRFLPDRKDADRSDNVKPGTVVDTTICHPRYFDFYLCSHSGIQGTSRPTRYFVVHDQNNFSADAIQELTYRMCYTYAKCTRSVSVVPAAYYAHLAAFRGKVHMGDIDISDSASMSSVALAEQTKAIASKFPKVER